MAKWPAKVRPKPARFTRRDQFYATASWIKRSRAYRREYPVCQICQKAWATCVDHVVSLDNGGLDEWENYQSLCTSCHSKKTVAKDGGLGRAPVN